MIPYFPLKGKKNNKAYGSLPYGPDAKSTTSYNVWTNRMPLRDKLED